MMVMSGLSCHRPPHSVAQTGVTKLEHYAGVTQEGMKSGCEGVAPAHTCFGPDFLARIGDDFNDSA